MKLLFLLIIILPLFTACEENKTEINKCENTICQNWEYCNSITGNCQLNKGYCNINEDCETNQICNINNQCVLFSNPCQWQNCSNHGDCILIDNLPKCICDEGFIENEFRCEQIICTENETTKIICGFNNNGLQTHICRSNVWTPTEPCIDTDVCINNNTRNEICDINNPEIVPQVCIDGEWIDNGDCSSYINQLGSNYNDSGNSIAVDGENYIYVTGQTKGGLDGNRNLGGNDVFLIKYDNTGLKLTIRQWGSFYDDFGNSVSVDESKNIYIAGYTSGNMEGNINAGLNDIFLTKFDSGGKLQWTKQWGTIFNDVANEAAIDSFGNIFVTGYTVGSLSSTQNYGGSDVFLTKLDNNGEILFTQQIGSGGDDFGEGITIDKDSNVYITGSFDGIFDTWGSMGVADIFLIKYDNNGNIQWSRAIGTYKNEMGTSLITDNSGNIFIAGHTTGDLDENDFDKTDMFVAKYDSEGNCIWKKQFGSSEDDYGLSITVDIEENLLITGSTTGNMINNMPSSYIDMDIFLLKLNKNGEKIDLKQVGTNYDDRGNDVSVDSLGNIFITGFIAGNLFDDSISGNNDVFLIKYINQLK